MKKKKYLLSSDDFTDWIRDATGLLYGDDGRLYVQFHRDPVENEEK